ncbi:hypothetical protein CCR75_009487 [Bremia lactucae]|uniref:Uncharacterized protein n=1 Tax=Bremia lactucae TaxID=4779 RepID=A0A976ID01_BRELC|nr:hypothetical protein CCR75_009487 [Bremia lactucae]
MLKIVGSIPKGDFTNPLNTDIEMHRYRSSLSNLPREAQVESHLEGIHTAGESAVSRQKCLHLATDLCDP